MFGNKDRKAHPGYFRKVKIGFNVRMDAQSFFDQPMKNDQTTYNIWKIATGQGDDYITGCLLDYLYFKEHYKLITIELSKQQMLDADPKLIQ